jgi:hypothetical protein
MKKLKRTNQQSLLDKFRSPTSRPFKLQTPLTLEECLQTIQMMYPRLSKNSPPVYWVEMDTTVYPYCFQIRQKHWKTTSATMEGTVYERQDTPRTEIQGSITIERTQQVSILLFFPGSVLLVCLFTVFLSALDRPAENLPLVSEAIISILLIFGLFLVIGFGLEKFTHEEFLRLFVKELHRAEQAKGYHKSKPKRWLK